MHRAFIFVAYGSTPLRHLSVVKFFCPEAAPFRRVVGLTACSFHQN